jgi:hypothetical protein
VNVVCCQAEVSASGWSLVQRNPTECGIDGIHPQASPLTALRSDRSSPSALSAMLNVEVPVS